MVVRARRPGRPDAPESMPAATTRPCTVRGSWRQPLRRAGHRPVSRRAGINADADHRRRSESRSGREPDLKAPPPAAPGGRGFASSRADSGARPPPRPRPNPTRCTVLPLTPGRPRSRRRAQGICELRWVVTGSNVTITQAGVALSTRIRSAADPQHRPDPLAPRERAASTHPRTQVGAKALTLHELPPARNGPDSRSGASSATVASRRKTPPRSCLITRPPAQPLRPAPSPVTSLLVAPSCDDGDRAVPATRARRTTAGAGKVRALPPSAREALRTCRRRTNAQRRSPAGRATSNLDALQRPLRPSTSPVADQGDEAAGRRHRSRARPMRAPRPRDGRGASKHSRDRIHRANSIRRGGKARRKCPVTRGACRDPHIVFANEPDTTDEQINSAFDERRAWSTRSEKAKRKGGGVERVTAGSQPGTGHPRFTHALIVGLTGDDLPATSPTRPAALPRRRAGADRE